MLTDLRTEILKQKTQYRSTRVSMYVKAFYSVFSSIFMTVVWAISLTCASLDRNKNMPVAMVHQADLENNKCQNVIYTT